MTSGTFPVRSKKGSYLTQTIIHKAYYAHESVTMVTEESKLQSIKETSY